MKKSLLMIVALMCATVSFAQSKGDKAVGLNLNYGCNYEGGNFTNLGVGAKFQYNITDDIRLSPEANYYLKKDHLSLWDLGVDGHYLFNLANDFNAYPIFGLGFYGWKNSVVDEEGKSVSVSDSKFGFRLGGGGEWKLTDVLTVNGEIKYAIVSGWSHLIFTAGLVYHF